MKGDIAPAKASFIRYLQSYPNGAFSLNAHYYLCVIGKEQKDEEAVLEHAGKLLEYRTLPTHRKHLSHGLKYYSTVNISTRHLPTTSS